MPLDTAVVRERLKPLFRDTFPDADVEAIGPETMADDVIGWDSMGHVNLIVSIEDTFAIRFDPEEITGFSNVGELMALIARKASDA